MWIMEFLHIYPIEDQPQDLRGSDNNWSRCSICGCNQKAYDEVSRTSCEPYFCCQTLWMFSLCNIVIRHKDWKTQPCMRWISTVQQNVLSSSGCQCFCTDCLTSYFLLHIWIVEFLLILVLENLRHHRGWRIEHHILSIYIVRLAKMPWIVGRLPSGSDEVE